MKKFLIIVMVILLIIIAALVSLGGLVKERDALTAGEFTSIMESKDFIIVDAGSQFANYDYIESATLAINENYQIEFYVLSDENYAGRFFANNKEKFESEKGTMSTSSSVNFANGAKYTLNTDGKFKVVTNIENTVIYLDVNESNKSEVESLLKEINY